MEIFRIAIIFSHIFLAMMKGRRQVINRNHLQRLCIFDEANTLKKYTSIENIRNIVRKIDVVILNAQYSSTSGERCDVALHLHNKSFRDNTCPGECTPVPIIAVPTSVFENAISNKSHDLTCSFPVNILNREYRRKNQLEQVSILLEAIFFRRIQECRERAQWPQLLPLAYKHRKRIDGLFIWVGTTRDMNLLFLQRSVLHQNLARSDEGANIAWLATEIPYSCNSNTSFCPEVYKGDQEYNKYLPWTGTCNQ